MRNGHLNQACVRRIDVMPANSGHPPASERFLGASAMKEQGAGVRQPRGNSCPLEGGQQSLAPGEGSGVKYDDAGNWLLPATRADRPPDAILVDPEPLQGAAVGDGH